MKATVSSAGLSEWGVCREFPAAAGRRAKTTSFYGRNPLFPPFSLVPAKSSFPCFCSLAGDDVFSVTSSTQSNVDYLGQSTKGDLNVKFDHLDSFGNFTLCSWFLFFFFFFLRCRCSSALLRAFARFLFVCSPWRSVSLGGSNRGSCQGGSWSSWEFTSPLGHPGTLTPTLLLQHIHMPCSASPIQLFSLSLIILFKLFMAFLFCWVHVFGGLENCQSSPSNAGFLDFKFHQSSFWVKLANLLVWLSFLFVPLDPVLQC